MKAVFEKDRYNKAGYYVHGRMDNKYTKPEFSFRCGTLTKAIQKFNEMIEEGAGTIFLEHYNKWGEQTKCYNLGHKLVDC